MASNRVAALAKDDILRAAASFRPSRKLQKWIVIIDGKEFPARPLLLHAAGVAPNDPTNSHQAVAKLQELGFKTRYVAESSESGTSLEIKASAGDQFSKELEWLEINRETYTGQWVALQGDRLLAAGPDARDVFVKVRDVFPPPLVVRVEDAGLPFAGW
jgi:hypothetical protein